MKKIITVLLVLFLCMTALSAEEHRTTNTFGSTIIWYDEDHNVRFNVDELKMSVYCLEHGWTNIMVAVKDGQFCNEDYLSIADKEVLKDISTLVKAGYGSVTAYGTGILDNSLCYWGVKMADNSWIIMKMEAVK